MKYESPFSRFIPRDVPWNIRFRRRLLSSSFESEEVRRLIWSAVCVDPVFFLGLLGVVHEPRIREILYRGRRLKIGPGRLPYVPYAYQVDYIKALVETAGEADLCVLKSRTMGATWTTLGVILWLWLTRPETMLGVMSRNVDAVDRTGDSNTLFWKLELMIRSLPKWMVPQYGRKRLRMENLSNGSQIIGTSTTGDAFRSGRAFAIFMDELASFEMAQGRQAMSSTQGTSLSRWMVSTSKGPQGAFAEMVNNVHCRQHRMHWTLHPDYRRGLYVSRGGRLELLDKEYEFPENYPFVLDGRTRSPFYDREEARCGSRLVMAREYDMDLQGADDTFFDFQVLDDHAKKYCRQPFHIGTLEYELGTAKPRRFVETSDFRPGTPEVRLWTKVSLAGVPPNAQYAAGADISAGTGNTNSTLCVARMDTGERVASARCSRMTPNQWAEFVVAFCRFFHNAFLCWEAAGPGEMFARALHVLGYANIYRRRTQDSSGNFSQTPGWYPTKQSKQTLLSEYQFALERGQFVNRENAALDECRFYIWKGDKVEHSGAISAEFDSSARKNHGDIAVADALCWHAIRERRGVEARLDKQASKDNTYFEMHARGEQKGDLPWLELEPSDLRDFRGVS